MKLQQNQVIEFGEGKKIKVLSLLGSGGQGEVYLVDYNGAQYALKTYIGDISSDFWYNLKNNVRRGTPSNVFLWPLELFEYNGIYGYLMEVRPKNYESFVSFLNGKVKFKDTTTLINWCIELCIGIKKLHEKGFSYQDLNDGSFFLDPNSGDILICDNDNITADKKNLGVLGKMKYMAPEIVRGDIDPLTKEKQMPDIHSDRFSLAIILFMALCLGNPFEGERLKLYDFFDEKAEVEMYGTHPVFVYHKTDKSNRPIRGYHASVLRRWAYLPIYVKEAFHKTFVEGLTDRENKRVTELEWIKCLTKYRDELITCGCGYQHLYGYEEKKTYDKCPKCNSVRQSFCELVINKNRIILQPGKMLYLPHIDKYCSEYNRPIGKVIVNKNNPNLWGIKLALDHEILIKDAAGVEKVIAGNGVIPIIKDLTIQFSKDVTGQINEVK